MTVDEFLNLQPMERQPIMTALHHIIITGDHTVVPVVEAMMGKEMIIYKERCYMKYALSGVKKYMSFHCMPIYGSAALPAKYAGLLPGAKFQKGCINFNSITDLPIAIAGDLISDCSKVSIVDMLENRKRK